MLKITQLFSRLNLVVPKRFQIISEHIYSCLYYCVKFLLSFPLVNFYISTFLRLFIGIRFTFCSYYSCLSAKIDFFITILRLRRFSHHRFVLLISFFLFLDNVVAWSFLLLTSLFQHQIWVSCAYVILSPRVHHSMPSFAIDRVPARELQLSFSSSTEKRAKQIQLCRNGWSNRLPKKNNFWSELFILDLNSTIPFLERVGKLLLLCEILTSINLPLIDIYSLGINDVNIILSAC